MFMSSRVGRFVALAAASATALWGMIAQGAPGDGGSPMLDAETQVSWRWLAERGGWPMYLLVAMSVLGLALVIYFFVILRREQMVPSRLRPDVLARIGAGQMDEARAACTDAPCPFAEIAGVALDFVKAGGKVDPTLLKEVVEGEGSRQATAIQAQTQYLLDVGVIAPMVGLLGTVFGMVNAFGVVALDVAKAKPMLLAAGVAQALVNTAGGLIVGIPAMMFYAYFRGRSSKLVSELEAASLDLLTSLVEKSRK
jgi:biopolymer transport protein ExbB